MAVPKIDISLMQKIGFARMNLSDTRLHFTVESSRQNYLVTG